MTDRGDVASSHLDRIVGRLAVESGLITPEQLRKAQEQQSRESTSGGGASRAISQILIESGAMSVQDLIRILDRQEKLKGDERLRRTLVSSTPSPSTPADEIALPPALGRFEILRELGRGGMGVVYEALDTQLKRKVALKLMLGSPGSEPAAAALDEERFVREAQMAAQLRHPNIVAVYDAGVLDGRRYQAMELIEGLALSDWAKGEDVPTRRRMEVLRDVARAVHYAHEQGILHRDLKPRNVLLDASGRPFVTDFGLAKPVQGGDQISLTGPGVLVGTPAYMSPEQAQGLKNLDRRTDVYSLGAILYEFLAGRPPFVGESALHTVVQVLKEPLVAPSQAVEEGVHVDPGVEKICLKALAKDPGQRYPTAEAMALDLEKWLAGESVHVSLGAGLRGRPVLPLAAGATAVAAVLVAAFFAFLPGRPAPAPPPPAPAPTALPPPREALVHVMAGHSLALWSLAVSPDGRRAASGAADKTARLWDLEAGKEIRVLGRHNGTVASLAFTPDGAGVLSGGWDNLLSLWDTATGARVRSFEGHKDRVQAVALSADGRRALSGSWDKTAGLWDVQTGARVRTLEGHQDRVYSVSFSPDGTRALTGSWDQTVVVWDLGTGRRLRTIDGHRAKIQAVRFSPDGRIIASGGRDNRVTLWDAETGRQIRVLSGHAGEIMSVAFSPDGRQVATGSNDQTVRVWDVSSGKETGALLGHSGFVECVSFTPDGRRVVSASSDRTVRVWRVE